MDQGAESVVGRFLNRRAALRLLRLHGEWRIREVLAALSEVPGFLPTGLLWGARHVDVPLDCLLQEGPEPEFRILDREDHGARVVVRVHYGDVKGVGAVRQTFVFLRCGKGVLELAGSEV